jgi:hypothetical protein
MSELSDAQCDLIRDALDQLDEAIPFDDGAHQALRLANARSYLQRALSENGGNDTPPPSAATNPPAAIVNQNGGQCAHILTAYTHVAPDGFTHEDCIDCGALLRLTGRPPARGTHSSDYPSGRRCPCADATTQTARNGPVPDQTYEAHLAEYEAAARWSRGL